jgi:hypothetical protein
MCGEIPPLPQYDFMALYSVKARDHGENCIMMNFITCILHRILLG